MIKPAIGYMFLNALGTITCIALQMIKYVSIMPRYILDISLLVALIKLSVL